jgi:phosphoribosylglycinamide formyltransferase-1
MEKPCSVVVLISGNGSNLQALIDASQTENFQVTAVISNNPEAFGLQRAANAGIPTITIDHRDFTDRISFDRALIARLEELNPNLIVLAGFMRILSEEFVRRFAHRILNIHPSLLPLYPGTNTHQRALDAGDQEHGASVHFVTEELDGGPVIAHAAVPVSHDDTAASLQQRVHVEEHRIYPQVVALFAAGRLKMHDGKAWLDNRELPRNGIRLE